jgi:hypothetical protein
LLLSVGNRHAYRVVSNAVGWCLVLWGGSAALLAVLQWAGHIKPTTTAAVLYATNPFMVMGVQTRAMLAAMPRMSSLGWWSVHCLLLVVGAALMLLWAACRIRRVALASVSGGDQATSQSDSVPAGAKSHNHWWPGRRGIRHVTGSPIVWREVHQPLFPRGRRGLFNIMGLVVGIGLIVAVLVFVVVRSSSTIGPLCYVVAGLLQLLFIVNLASSAASTFTREKEARTLPILLLTPLDNREIIKAKAVGLLRRNLPLLIPVPILGLLAYWLTPSGSIPARGVLTIVLSEISAVGDVVLFLGLGLCLSVYFKASTPAVVATFVAYIAFRIFVGFVAGGVFLVGVRCGLFRPDDSIIRYGAMVSHVVGFGGLGVLLGYIGAAGLRRNCM